MLKTIRSILLSVFIITIILFGLLGFKVYEALEYKNPNNINMLVKKGMSLKKISQVLSSQKVIQDPTVFEFYLRFFKKGLVIKAGEYDIQKGFNLEQVANWMIEGKVKRYKFTIPEGYNYKETCRVLAQKNIMSLNQCLNFAENTENIYFKEKQNIETLEGYLFPSTYYYEKDESPQSIIKQMVDLFNKKFGDNWDQNKNKTNLNLHQVVILASIIEKETGVAEERPLIAGVFLNRLKKGMLLQSDPTVIYGIKDFDGNIRRRDLEKDTPYNTYTRAGLPKGPICNPGYESLMAVVNPVQTEYYYFVGKGDGSHYFSKTLSEHNAAVRKYQLKK